MTTPAVAALVRSAAAALALIAALGGAGASSGPSAIPLPAPLALLPSVGTAHAARLGEAADVTLTSASLMTRLVNADRAAHGLTTLRFDQGLRTFAQWRSQDMAAADYFSHDVGNLPGRQIFDLLRAGGVTYRVAGENLARVYGDPGSPDAGDTAAQAEVALMASPTHRANILRPDYTHLGVGVAVAGDGRVLYTQLFKTAW